MGEFRRRLAADSSISHSGEAPGMAQTQSGKGAGLLNLLPLLLLFATSLWPPAMLASQATQLRLLRM